MIGTAIIYVLYYALYAVLSVTILLLPDVSSNSTVVAAITTITPYAAVLNTVIPFGTIFQIFSVSVGIFLLVAAYRGVLWVIRLIRG